MRVIVVRTEEDQAAAMDALRGKKALGCDTETSGLSPGSGKILSVQISDGETAVLIPVSEGAPLENFAKLFTDMGTVKIFHNAKFDVGFLSAAGQRIGNVFDTMIAEKLLTKGARQSVSLAETLYRHFAVDLDKSHRKSFGRNWKGIWTDELVTYAIEDVVYLPRLREIQLEWMEKLGLTGEFDEEMDRFSATMLPK